MVCVDIYKEYLSLTQDYSKKPPNKNQHTNTDEISK